VVLSGIVQAQLRLQVGVGFPQIPVKSTAQATQNTRENNRDRLDGIEIVDILS
jgi:hypothetical protein